MRVLSPSRPLPSAVRGDRPRGALRRVRLRLGSRAPAGIESGAFRRGDCKGPGAHGEGDHDSYREERASRRVWRRQASGVAVRCRTRTSTTPGRRSPLGLTFVDSSRRSTTGGSYELEVDGDGRERNDEGGDRRAPREQGARPPREYRADGMVHLTPIWFDWDGEKFRLTLGAGRVHLKNLQRDPAGHRSSSRGPRVEKGPRRRRLGDHGARHGRAVAGRGSDSRGDLAVL